MSCFISRRRQTVPCGRWTVKPSEKLFLKVLSKKGKCTNLSWRTCNCWKVWRYIYLATTADTAACICVTYCHDRNTSGRTLLTPCNLSPTLPGTLWSSRSPSHNYNIRYNVYNYLRSFVILRKLHLYLQGDRANGMYFVESGTLVVLKRIDGDEKEVSLKILCPHFDIDFLFLLLFKILLLFI